MGVIRGLNAYRAALTLILIEVLTRTLEMITSRRRGKIIKMVFHNLYKSKVTKTTTTTQAIVTIALTIKCQLISKTVEN